MATLYKITRTPINHGHAYRFELINAYTFGVVLTAWGTSPVAPGWLVRRRKQLNEVYAV